MANKYVVRGASHSRLEGEATVTYAAGDPIEPTKEELKAFPDRFELVGSGRSAQDDQNAAAVPELTAKVSELETQVAALTTQRDEARTVAEGFEKDLEASEKKAKGLEADLKKEAKAKTDLAKQLEAAQQQAEALATELETLKAATPAK